MNLESVSWRLRFQLTRQALPVPVQGRDLLSKPAALALQLTHPVTVAVDVRVAESPAQVLYLALAFQDVRLERRDAAPDTLVLLRALPLLLAGLPARSALGRA
jgi:hypothetical protein